MRNFAAIFGGLFAAALLSFATALPATAQNVRSKFVDALPASKPSLVEAYGPDKLQFGELRLPDGAGPFPVAVIIHGGCWTKGYATLKNTAPLATQLTAKGIATWNIEYRQVGDKGGGWPGTLLDWGAATDHVRKLAESWLLDLSRVIVIGHSTGAPASLFVAARPHLPPNPEIRGADPLRVGAAVAIDGPLDLPAFIGKQKEVCGKPVLEAFMGGDATAQHDRYEQISPVNLVPIDVPQFLVAAQVLSSTEADAYHERAIAAGDNVEVLALPGTGHFDMIAPGTEAYFKLEDLIVRGAVAVVTRQKALSAPASQGNAEQVAPDPGFMTPIIPTEPR
jgi:acetyl esterase/lipase